jgi:hypothetical protein
MFGSVEAVRKFQLFVFKWNRIVQLHNGLPRVVIHLLVVLVRIRSFGLTDILGSQSSQEINIVVTDSRQFRSLFPLGHKFVESNLWRGRRDPIKRFSPQLGRSVDQISNSEHQHLNRSIARGALNLTPLGTLRAAAAISEETTNLTMSRQTRPSGG